MRRLPEKEQRETHYKYQKQYKQRKDQQNNNNYKTKMGRKTIIWEFQATNKRNFKRENLVIAKKEKPQEKMNLFY